VIEIGNRAPACPLGLLSGVGRGGHGVSRFVALPQCVIAMRGMQPDASPVSSPAQAGDPVLRDGND
ncbi:hypothetical protein, partial [Salmonella enterica]|uniref:hypothetical protein n=1 Tax=Salmonella enterica TaxID=28901 RepID=UPI0019D61A8E